MASRFCASNKLKCRRVDSTGSHVMQAASDECVNNKLTAIIWPMFASDDVARVVLRADHLCEMLACKAPSIMLTRFFKQ